ncbi:conserved hypothetical protein [Paraburkholderia piptadeniae]|uniref:Uncharacterized protein n=1 Tax=Paraburkholderia piptadeniae TaxID=1701573 RepID=A0A1N7SSY1_9BURK|nr:hypothetical protein [Paraburkholderia piptadeniae]SIT50468.1 conserved hypothetical protein [Paraburkholderia piptadeniae]
MTVETAISLSEDQKTVAKKKIVDLSQAVGTLHRYIEEGRPIDVEFAKTVACVTEYKLSDLCKTLGIETFGTKEREERHAKLRAANLEIHELQTQLGKTLSPEATQEAIKNIAAHLNKWWNLDGFGYVHDLEFGQYGVCHGRFSCSLHGTFRLIDSDTPVSDKENKATWIDSLRERGFELIKDGREWAILDCDTSRKAIIDLFAERIPSAKVVKFDNYNRTRAGDFVLSNAEVYIYKLSEILALPIPAEEAQ